MTSPFSATFELDESGGYDGALPLLRTPVNEGFLSFNDPVDLQLNQMAPLDGKDEATAKELSGRSLLIGSEKVGNNGGGRCIRDYRPS